MMKYDNSGNRLNLRYNISGNLSSEIKVTPFYLLLKKKGTRQIDAFTSSRERLLRILEKPRLMVL